MMKSEFEALALKGNAEIGPVMYQMIERFYTSENDYHAAHGGLYETKQQFVKRVFGGKVNTPCSIAKKIAAESIRENRWALKGTCQSDETLTEMDKAITDHYMTIYRRGW
ncbi:MAG: hypothetical protein II008_19850 [Oscillospiraceae bacterium]|jgi:hypothetical protein|nr:hypothetical protein [Oscillospiraceae bacterium]